MKKTNREIINFVNAASLWSQRQAAAKEPQTKLSYAVARMLKRCQKTLDDFNAKLEDARLENAMEDEKTKSVLLDEARQYRFTKEGTKAIIEFQRGLLNEEVEIEPYIVTSLPGNVSDESRIAFEDFVMKPDEEPAGE